MQVSAKLETSFHVLNFEEKRRIPNEIALVLKSFDNAQMKKELTSLFENDHNSSEIAESLKEIQGDTQ
jgi:hypothetical protein